MKCDFLVRQRVSACTDICHHCQQRSEIGTKDSSSSWCFNPEKDCQKLPFLFSKSRRCRCLSTQSLQTMGKTKSRPLSRSNQPVRRCYWCYPARCSAMTDHRIWKFGPTAVSKNGIVIFTTTTCCKFTTCIACEWGEGGQCWSASCGTNYTCWGWSCFGTMELATSIGLREDWTSFPGWLTEHDGIDKTSLTGSSATSKLVMKSLLKTWSERHMSREEMMQRSSARTSTSLTWFRDWPLQHPGAPVRYMWTSNISMSTKQFNDKFWYAIMKNTSRQDRLCRWRFCAC